MESSQKLRFAGEYNLNRVQIINSKGLFQDITDQVLAIQLYEDIFSPVITGSISIKESLDLVNLLPFIGEEYVDLDITTPSLGETDLAIKGKFYIYKMNDREMAGDRAAVYQLQFISQEAIVDRNKRLSRAFADKISKLVEPLLKDPTVGLETKKNVYVEETINNIKYVSTFWSPITNIQYLVEHAANMNKTPNFVFFENRDGFYFTSLEALYSNGTVKQEFVMDKYTRDQVSNAGDVRNVEEDYKRILDISIPVSFDYIERLSNGMLGSKMLSYDVTKKTYTTKNYSMFDRFKEQKHLNPNAINSDKAIYRWNSLIMNYPTNYGLFNGYGDVTAFKTHQERTSLMQLAESNRIQITVPGRTDYTVGQKVKVTLNKTEPASKKDTDTTDYMHSGHYLIAALNHRIDREKHECHMELIKESSLMDMNK